jgi:hypothetical protein
MHVTVSWGGIGCPYIDLTVGDLSEVTSRLVGKMGWRDTQWDPSSKILSPKMGTTMFDETLENILRDAEFTH